MVNAQNIKFQLHSHNDYEQEFPLTTALSNNFKSIEVDIFEYDNDIIVSHDDDDLNLKPTLSKLYLEPLSIYPFEKKQTTFLLVDLKMEGHKILNDLHILLKSYPNLFKNRTDLTQNGPIQVILSGSVDKDYVISNDSFSYFFLDGRIIDLVNEYDSSIVPLISANIEDFLCWKPNKKITKSDLRPIISAIDNTHQQGKMIRFWNTSDSPELWDLLLAMKVDLIGVDDINKFMNYSAKFKNP